MMIDRTKLRMLLLALCLWVSAPAFGWEKPVFQVDILDVKHITTVDSSYSSLPGFKPHIRFPGIDKRGDGSMRIWWNVGQTHGVYPSGGNTNATSSDNGQTWTVVAPMLVLPYRDIRAPGSDSYGFYPMAGDGNNTTPFNSFQVTRYRSTNGGITWPYSDTATFNTSPVSYTYLYTNRGEIIIDAGVWLLTCFGKQNAGSNYELVLFTSTDSGLNWSRRATIASYVGGLETSMGPEGPNEGNIVPLINGNFLAIYRTGQAFPTCDVYAIQPSMCWSISTDKGYTWSPPKMLGVTANQPNIQKMSDGSVAVTYGRYGGKIIFADETGTRWSDPFVVYDMPSCGSVQMVPTDDGKFVFIHNISSFYNPGHEPNPPACYVYKEYGQEIAHMKAVLLDIKRVPVIDEFEWNLEYHGDVAPDTLAEPWIRTGTGSSPGVAYEGDVLPETATPPWTSYGGVFTLGTDGGTDFFNIDSTVTGGGYVEIGGVIPDIVNDGVIIEARMRVFDTTHHCGGINFGDGATGAEFHFYVDSGNHKLRIRRQNGTLTYPVIPGDPANWHIYKVIADNGYWNLYVDDQWVFGDNTGYFTEDMVRFGDGTGSGSDCNVDYDYIRITPGTATPIKPYLWADNGQDYLRFDTGPSGITRDFYYTLGPAGTSWDAMNFADNVIVELRARVSGSTSQGAGNIFLSDGTGYVSLELTSSGVNLEGAGDNAGQDTYAMDTSQWHTYRIEIEGSDASVYLDGGTTAILENVINPTTGVDEIRIGDMTGTNNGIWDLDFLRFTTPPCGLQAYPRGDVTENCIVNMYDLKVIIDNWLMWDYAPPVTGDLTGDNRVDLEDYAVIGDNWLDDRQP